LSIGMAMGVTPVGLKRTLMVCYNYFSVPQVPGPWHFVSEIRDAKEIIFYEGQ
jgi:hypothetical protein